MDWLSAVDRLAIFFYFIGTVTGGMGRPSAEETIGVLTGQNTGFLADEFVRRLEELGYKVDRVDARALASYGRRITI